MVFHGSVVASGDGNPNMNQNSLMNGTDANHYGGGSGGNGYDGNNDYNNNNALMTVVEEEAEMAVVGATYTSFATGRRARPKVSHWTVEETQLFYEALQQVGMDFGTMEAYFEAAALDNGRNNNKIRFRERRQLKRKYQAEYNKNPQLIEKTLQCQGRVGIDLSIFHLSDDVVHSIEPALNHDVPDNDMTTAITTESDERNDIDTTTRLNHPGTNSRKNLINLNSETTNDHDNDNEMILYEDELDHDISTTMLLESVDTIDTTFPLFNQNDMSRNLPNTSLPHGHHEETTTVTGTTNTGTSVPPKINTKKSKVIRPLRSAATRTIKRKQGGK